MDNPSFASQYLGSLSDVLRAIDASQVQQAVETLRDARDRGSTIYSCGNGGSASIASQMVVDLVKGGSYGKKTPRIKMIGLTDSIATMTAYANDVSYDSVFVEQLKNWATPGDVLIAISGSGNSQNVLNAVEYANDCDVIYHRLYHCQRWKTQGSRPCPTPRPVLTHGSPRRLLLRHDTRSLLRIH